MTAPDLAAFLTARLDDDERIARAAVVPAHDAPNAYKPHPALARWRYSGDEVLGGNVEVDWDEPGPYPETWKVTSDSEYSSSVSDADGRHIARFDPGWVLADIDAKRRIIERHTVHGPWSYDVGPAPRGPSYPVGCTTLRLLALPYVDHPDYDESWRPMIRIVYDPRDEPRRLEDWPREGVEVETSRDWNVDYVHELVDRLDAMIRGGRKPSVVKSDPGLMP